MATEPQSAPQTPPPSPSRRGRSYARLSYQHPQRKTAYKDILRHTTLIGSSADCHVRLLSADIAPAHCVITVDNEIIRVRALRPNAAIRVNGYAFDISKLSHGDRLEIGPFLFRVETNLTFELSKTALVPETRMDLPQSADSVTAAETAATTSADSERTLAAPVSPTGIEPADAKEPVAAPPESGHKPITLEFLKSLMLKGVLTRFQTDWLMEGRFQEFTLDGYRIVDILGTGGMGWLYVGVDQTTGEKAAVKVISRQMDNDYLTRFKLEARAGLLLNDPNIVRTLKLGETEEILYVAMELVEGISLQELITREGSISAPRAASIILQAAAGLHHAHEKGMVHRDVKPGNLLVKKDGTVKILDFGLALLDKDEDEFSLAMISGQGCVGTADYIPPEQTIDSFGVGPRADVYSLGCTLYCALTGSVPFPGESVSKKLNAHRTKTARPLRELKPEIPAAIEAIVQKMMARKPADRYASAAEVVAALKPYARREPTEFDFAKMLQQRSQEARQRVNILRQRR